MFLGVNLTFFPIHFLGLQGIPRRYRDYPDVFSYWNIICSFGSLLSLLAVFLLLCGIVERVGSLRSLSYSSALSRSLEWKLGFPLRHHTFSQITVSFV
jgi:heme/copper-type cytochrome/quinol oxidase subunit 1